MSIQKKQYKEKSYTTHENKILEYFQQYGKNFLLPYEKVHIDRTGGITYPKVEHFFTLRDTYHTTKKSEPIVLQDKLIISFGGTNIYRCLGDVSSEKGLLITALDHDYLQQQYNSTNSFFQHILGTYIDHIYNKTVQEVTIIFPFLLVEDQDEYFISNTNHKTAVPGFGGIKENKKGLYASRQEYITSIGIDRPVTLHIVPNDCFATASAIPPQYIQTGTNNIYCSMICGTGCNMSINGRNCEIGISSINNASYIDTLVEKQLGRKIQLEDMCSGKSMSTSFRLAIAGCYGEDHPLTTKLTTRDNDLLNTHIFLRGLQEKDISSHPDFTHDEMILLHIFSEYYVCRAKNYLLAILTTVINSIPDTSAHDTLLIQRDGSVILNNPLLKKEVENDCQQNIPDKTIIFTNFEIKKHKNNKITSSLYGGAMYALYDYLE